MPPPDFEAITTTLGHVNAQKYFFVACSVVLFWNIVITFGKEVEYIWKQRWTPFTFLWFLLRYIPPLMEIVLLESLFESANRPRVCCKGELPFGGSFAMVSVTLVQSVFTLRLYALYGRKNYFLYVFGLFLAGEIAFTGFITSRTVEVPNKLPGVTGCVVGLKSFGNRGGAAFCAPPFIFDTIVFGMTMYKSYITARDNQSFGVLDIIRRDGTLYFFCVFCSNTANFITILAAPKDLNAFCANLATTLPITITSHLILNLKSIAYRENDILTRADIPLEFNHNTQSSGYVGPLWSINALVDVLAESGHPVAPQTSLQS